VNTYVEMNCAFVDAHLCKGKKNLQFGNHTKVSEVEIFDVWHL